MACRLKDRGRGNHTRTGTIRAQAEIDKQRATRRANDAAGRNLTPGRILGRKDVIT